MFDKSSQLFKNLTYFATNAYYNSNNTTSLMNNNKVTSLNYNNSSLQNQSQGTNDNKPETEKAFLERVQVKHLLNSLLDSLFKNQPEDPIGYICNYFESLNHQDDQLSSALDRVKSINHASPVFDDCLLDLYNNTNKMIKTNNSKKNSTKVQLGEIYNNIVDSLTSDILPDIREQFLKIVKKRDYDAISFDVFRSSIKIISIFKEYLNQCKNLFKELEIYSNSDKVNKALCVLLLQQLTRSFDIIERNNDKECFITIESLYELSPSGLSALLEEKYEKNVSKSNNAINLNDFLLLASQCFFKQISQDTDD